MMLDPLARVGTLVVLTGLAVLHPARAADAEGQECCQAMTAECLACQAGITVPEFCFLAREQGEEQGDTYTNAGCDPAVQTTTPRIAPTSYDCEAEFADWETEWSQAKKRWCCREKGRGCEPFNCQADRAHSERSWPKGKKDWCCFYRHVGCRHDCREGLSNTSVAWSEEKKDWCCETQDRGCSKGTIKEAPTTTSTARGSTSSPFDCEAGSADWRTEWSQGKQDWCCVYHGRGCRHDCEAGLSSWKQKWSEEKKVWCCKTHELGCDAASSGGAAAEDEALATAEEEATGRTPRGAATTAMPADPTTSEAAAAPRTTTPCFQPQITWEPLDMRDVEGPTKEASAFDCQKRCARTRGCAHFSYWTLGRHCHLQDSFAIAQRARIGFVSGPFQCWEHVNKTEYIKLSSNTFVPKALRCVEAGALYSPIMGVPMYLPTKSITSMEAIQECQKHCAGVRGCEHFTVQFPHRLCRLAASTAHKLPSAINSVSGPRICRGPEEEETMDNPDLIIRRDAVPDGALRHFGTFGSGLFLAAISAMLVAAVTTAAGVLVRRVRRDIARGSALPLQSAQPGYFAMAQASPGNLLRSAWAGRCGLLRGARAAGSPE